uniref:SAM domain-containing protein n=1 Tax=Periophthalmus magnuspinnatus TaxID=409849 RepID=A0A3B4AZP4_9GOBI
MSVLWNTRVRDFANTTFAVVCFPVKEEALDLPSLSRGTKRSLSGVSPPYAAPLSPKHLRTEAHPSEEREGVPSKNPSSWTIEEVMQFVRDADPMALAPHAELFRKHEIDGRALMLLRSDMIMKYMGLKLGPALKLCHHIERLKQGKL